MNEFKLMRIIKDTTKELIIPVGVFKEIVRLVEDSLKAQEMHHLHRIETFDLDEEEETAERDSYDLSTKEYLLKLSKDYYDPYLHGMIKNTLKIDYINKEEIILKHYDVCGIGYILYDYKKWLEVELGPPEKYDDYHQPNKKHLLACIKFENDLHMPIQEYIDSIKSFIEVLRACSDTCLVDKKYLTVKGYLELCKKYI